MSDEIVLNEDHVARLREAYDLKKHSEASMNRALGIMQARDDVANFLAYASLEDAEAACRRGKVMVLTESFNPTDLKGVFFVREHVSSDYMRAWTVQVAHILFRYHDRIFRDQQ